MRKIKTLIIATLVGLSLNAGAQGDVFVNMNMVHWVDTVSDFGRDRHFVLHSDPAEDDWQNEGDKLDYLINDLDTYFGRDNGYASWYCSQTPQDPNKANWFDYEWMRETGGPAAKNNYAQLAKRTQGHQFDRKGHMIMGTNPQPLYPSLGTDAGLGWMPLTVETSAQWQGEYLANYFSKGEGDAGLPIPEYWEVVNEIDMVMNLHASYLITSYETIWKYHNLAAQAVKSKLGDKAPKIGGMTWGMHDFHRGDGVTNRALGVESDKAAGYSWSAYEDMYLSDLKRNNYMDDDWYQWDCYWQGFLEHCGDNMDYHSIHIYDWPEYDQTTPTIRVGGHTEAMLDMIEWYDIKMGSGAPKEVVVSEYGAVAGEYNAGRAGIDDDRRDWENLKPFNSMLMQFLERPNTIRITSQFTPTIAHWGDGTVTAGVRYPYKMLDDVDGDGDYDWTQFIKFYELWSDVNGTRVETKSTDVDVQVDAYVDGNHMYLILNNMLESSKTLNMHYYDDDNKVVNSVSVKELWLDESISNGSPTITKYTVKNLLGQITLKPDATIILDVEFADELELDKTVREYKLMGERLNTTTVPTDAGTRKFTVDTKQNPTQSMTIKNVPAFSGSDEVKLRVTGSFFNDANSQINSLTVKVNNNTLSADKFYRGEMKAKHNLCLGTIEVDVPLAYLKAGDNDFSVSYGNTAGFACCQLQYWKFSDAPGRGDDNVAVTGVSVPSALTMQVGETNSFAAAIAPANASNKTINWSSDNSAVTVDANGLLTAKSTGSAKITATCGGQSDVCTVTVEAYAPIAATGVSIEGAPSINVGHNDFYRLTPEISPADASIQSITWASTDETVAMVYDNGTVNGIEIGGSTTITATVKDNSGHTHQASILVNVSVAGDEFISCAGIEDTVSANTSYDFIVTVNGLKDRGIKLELMKGANLIGTATSSIVKDGVSRIKVSMTTNIVPTQGNYILKGYLLDGATVLSTNEEPLYVETVVPDSIAIKDWLWEVEKDGGTLQIQATVFPEEAYDKTINWSSSDESKAKVDANGLVTGQVNTGIVTITAKTQSGNVARYINIDVKDNLEVIATNIELSDVITVFPGTSHNVMVEYAPSWATNKEINWVVTDESVVKFTSGNTFDVLGTEGTSTTITGTYAADANLKVTATVKVSDIIYIEAEEYEATGGSYDDDADGGTAVAGAGANTYTTAGEGAINYINSGDWMTYPVYVPETGMYNISFYAGTEAAITDGVVNFKVDGESLGTVTVKNEGWDNFQLVTISNVLIEKGAKTITVEAVGGSLYQWNMEHFEIEMAGPVAVTGIEVTPEEWKLLDGGTKMLTANVLPGSATNRDVTWSTGSASVATVNATSGLVTAEGLGTTYIYATTDDGSFKDSCEIAVETTILVDSIQVTPSPVTLSAGNNQQLMVKIFPEYAANTEVTFTSNDLNTTTVSTSGLVTAVANGTTTITVAAKDASGVTKRVDVIVAPVLVESVLMVPETAKITVGSTVALNAIITPSNADNLGVKWSSDDDGIASVSSIGVVKGEGAGTATITVTTDDGSKTATCKVTVDIDNSIGESISTNIILYPNPASSNITVGGLAEGNYTVKIYSTLGIVVALKENVTADESAVNIEDLPVGIYMLSIESDNDKKLLRFLKGD